MDETEFALWLHKVDAILMNRYGLTSYDFEDYRWRDEFDDGTTARRAVSNAEEYWGVEVQ